MSEISDEYSPLIELLLINILVWAIIIIVLVNS